MARNTTYRLTPVDKLVGNPDLVPPDQRRADFGRRLMALMLKEGINQSELARRAGLGRDSISGYVNGRNFPDPKNANALAQVFGIPVEQLYAESVDRALEKEALSFEIRVAAGHPGKAWLRVNQIVSFSTAAKVATLLQDEAE